MTMKIIIILIMLFTSSLQGYTQYKYEKESRIRKSNVPANAINFVDSVNFNSKVKWYRETGLKSISFEAKTKYKGKDYSIEFSEDGSFEDVEIKIESSEVPSTTFDIISKYLSEQHSRYTIEKVQVQYSGNKKSVLEFLQNKSTNVNFVINYELKISSKVEGSFKMFEYLFSENGKFIQKSQIILRRTDNIEF